MALKAVLDYFEPSPPPNRGLGDHLYHQFVRQTQVEAVVTVGLTALACYFSSSNGLRLAFIKKAVTVLSLNLLARAVATGCRYAAIIENKGLFFRTVSFGAEWIAPYYFARGLTKSLIHPLIHEAGHALVSYTVYRGNKIEIVANNLFNWVTHSQSTGYSVVGRLLGPHYSKMVFLAGGTLTTVIAAQFALVMSLHFRYANLSKYAFLTSIFALGQEFGYAKSALTGKEVHDFTQLWKEGGLHPWAAMTLIVAQPVISAASYLFFKR